MPQLAPANVQPVTKAHQRFIREELSKTEPSYKADIATAVVQEITSSQAKEIIVKNEWLRSMPAVVLHCYGIFFDGLCGGAVVFGQEYGENLKIWDKFGYTGKIICLARGACVHWAHPHSASKLIRTSMRMLPEKYKVVTATVDETAGEIGIIYQAATFSFCGVLSKGNTASIITPEGKRISDREAFRLYGTRSIRSLREMGLDVRSDPRKGRYFAFLGSKREQRENRKAIEHLIKPYPKRPPQASNAIQINPEFRALIGPLTKEERQQLEANLIANGCIDPLVTWRGILLDGHNRFEICERLRIPYKTVQIDLPSAEAAKLWIEEHQIGRRNLTTDQRAAIAYRIMQRRVAISKQERARKAGTAAHSLSLVRPSALSRPPSPRQREVAASQLGITPNRLRVVSAIAKESPEVIEQLVAGTLTIKQAQEEIAEQTRQRLRKAAKKIDPKESQIHVGDASLLNGLIKDGSADLFLTAPPNGKDAIPLYGRLAKTAQRKLRPGGLCAVLCGQLFFDHVLKEMTKHLDYYWVAGIVGDGKARSARVFNRRMINALQLVVIFAKRPLKQMARSALPFMTDLIPGEQGQQQLQYVVEHLSKPGQLVVLPFCGGDGNLPVACAAIGRRFIGTELDPVLAVAARRRVTKFRKAQLAG